MGGGLSKKGKQAQTPSRMVQLEPIRMNDVLTNLKGTQVPGPSPALMPYTVQQLPSYVRSPQRQTQSQLIPMATATQPQPQLLRTKLGSPSGVAPLEYSVDGPGASPSTLGTRVSQDEAWC